MMTTDHGGAADARAIEGAASVRMVRELHGFLLERLRAGVGVTLDLSAAQSADAAFFQLVVSARSSFRDAGLPFEVIDPHAVLPAVFAGS